LLALVAKTCSTTLPKELQVKSLKVVQAHHKGNLQLQAQAILTETALMEVYGFQHLAELPAFLDHVISGFLKEPQAYHDVYQQALLKAIVCVNTMYLKFLTADQLEKILMHTLTQPSRLDQEVEQALEAVCAETVAQKKLILSAVMNAYGQVAQ
jgi:hypothetical protein